MITVIVIVIVVEILLHLGHEPTEARVGVGLFGGIIIGLLVAFWIGSGVPYVQSTTKQPMVGIYTNQDKEEIFLKAISGSQLLYRVMDNGVPRDRTISTGSVTKVITEDVSPYVETTTSLFKHNWYKYFAFSSKNDVIVFHVPETGVEADINSFLK